MSTSEQVDSTASSTWSARNLIPTRLVSYFRPGYRYHINNPDPEKSTSEQTDQKVKTGATWRFWEWRPMRWIFSYCQPRQDNNIIIMKYTGECPPSEDNHRTQDAFCYENENEVFGLKTNKNRSRLRNGELHIDLNNSDHEDIAMKKDCDQLRKRHEELPRDISRRDEVLSDLKRKCEQLQTINKEQQKQLSKLEPENVVLTRNCSQLQTRMNELQRDLIKRDQENNALKIDCDQLRTRLSQTAAIQLTQGNPNIADLSDQNRPDKLAEQFSELYDNQWTDCYLVLTDGLGKTEEESISILLKVVKTSYDICRDRCQNISRSTKDILFDFAGCLHEKPDNALDALIQEILHKLKSHRTKSFKGVPKNIRNETKAKLASEIGELVSADCDCFIDECIRICWLMCIKDPPMYICCHHEAVFDKSKYMEYTEMGQNITYVVWPALYLHKDGPFMRKGVAQGGDKIGGKETGKMKELTSQVCEPDHTQPSIASTNNATKMERQETESRSYSSDGNIAANIQTYTDINSDNNNINKHESPENERFNENASCSNIQNGDEVCTSSIETSDQYILDSVKSAANETHQSVKDAILYDASLSNDNNDTNSQLETNVEKAGLRFKEVKNRMTETHEEPLKCNNGHNKTEALNRSQAGSIGYEDKNDVESRSYLIKSYTSNDDSLKKENEKLICKYSTNGEPTERKERNETM